MLLKRFLRKHYYKIQGQFKVVKNGNEAHEARKSTKSLGWREKENLKSQKSPVPLLLKDQ